MISLANVFPEFLKDELILAIGRNVSGQKSKELLNDKLN